MEITAFRPSRTVAAKLPDARPLPLLEARAWHWVDLGWGLAVVAASGSGSAVYLFLLYPIALASLRLGRREGAAVALAAIAGWLAIELVQGHVVEWQHLLLRAASLAALGYAVARWAASEAELKRRLRRLADIAADAERRKISLDLHDSAIQPYLGLKLGLEALRRKVEAGDALSRDIDELYRMTQDSIAELRGYVRVLDGRAEQRPAALADALRRQIERFHRFYGIQVDLDIPSDLGLGDGMTDDIAQMVGESLSNVGRHTASRHAAIALSRDGGDLVMRIVDGGMGKEDGWQPFTPISLTRRAQRLGGRVEVAPAGNGGSILRITIPLER